jgi:putative SOS response-associated peptidase YedK
MCGRFSIDATIEEMSRRFKASPMLHPLTAEGVVFPSMLVAMVTNCQDSSTSRVLISASWGIGVVAGKQLMINARSETIKEKPLFSEAFSLRRGILPATSFFEWEEASGQKLPHEYFLPERKMFGIAAIYARNHEDDRSVGELVIITVPAIKPVAKTHARMPLVLSGTMEAQWLSAGPLSDEAWENCRMDSPVAGMEDMSPMPHLFE